MEYSRRFLTVAIFVLSLIVREKVPAQFVQQGIKLVGTGAVGNAEQGFSVALASDGNTALAGGPGDNTSVGAVWAAFVFTRSGGVWSAKAKLIGTGVIGYNPSQGNAVAISPDGWERGAMVRYAVRSPALAFSVPNAASDPAPPKLLSLYDPAQDRPWGAHRLSGSSDEPEAPS